jgi:hypothetical protein
MDLLYCYLARGEPIVTSQCCFIAHQIQLPFDVLMAFLNDLGKYKWSMNHL